MRVIPLWLDTFDYIENDNLRELNIKFARIIHEQLVDKFFKSLGFYLEGRYFCYHQIPEGWRCKILEFGRFSYEYHNKEFKDDYIHIWIEPYCNLKCEKFLPDGFKFGSPDNLKSYTPDFKECELRFDYEIMLKDGYKKLGDRKIDKEELHKS